MENSRLGFRMAERTWVYSIIRSWTLPNLGHFYVLGNSFGDFLTLMDLMRFDLMRHWEERRGSKVQYNLYWFICRHVHASDVWFYARTSGLCLRSPPARGEHRASWALSVVPPGVRAPPQKWECSQSESRSCFSSGELPRALQDPGEPPVFAAQPPEAATAVAQSALHRGREAERPSARRRREVPRPEKVPPAPLYLGRRGDELLLQREEQEYPPRVVHPQPLSIPTGEKRAGRGHGTHDHASQQLVQKPTAERSSGWGKGKVGVYLLLKTDANLRLDYFIFFYHCHIKQNIGGSSKLLLSHGLPLLTLYAKINFWPTSGNLFNVDSMDIFSDLIQSPQIKVTLCVFLW